VQSLSLRAGIAVGLNINQTRAVAAAVSAAKTVAAGVSPAVLVESGSLRSSKFPIISRLAVACAVSAQDEMNFGFTPQTTRTLQPFSWPTDNRGESDASSGKFHLDFRDQCCGRATYTFPRGVSRITRRGLLINDNRMSNTLVREWSRGDASGIDGQTDRSNGAFGKSDIEGKTAREAANELGKERVSNERERMSQNLEFEVSMRRFASPCLYGGLQTAVQRC